MRKWNVCIPLKKRKSYQNDVVSGDFVFGIFMLNLWASFHFDQTDHLHFCNKTEDSSNNCYGFIGGNPLNLYLPCLVVLLLNLYSPWFWSIRLLNSAIIFLTEFKFCGLLLLLNLYAFACLIQKNLTILRWVSLARLSRQIYCYPLGLVNS